MGTIHTVVYMYVMCGMHRAPEVLFQPTIVGVDQCGISDTIEYILQSYPSDLQQRLVEVTPLIRTLI